MSLENKKRHNRTPYTSEELARIIAFKKNKARQKLLHFKSSGTYKALNIFNVVCFFIYWELMFCCFGPCYYHHEEVKFISAKHETQRDRDNRPFVIEVKVKSNLNEEYHLIVNDFLKIPKEKFNEMEVGCDFILHKKLRAKFWFSDQNYRLSEANPVLFMTVLVIFIMSTGFYFNLNEHPYSLRGISFLNLLTLFALLFI